MEMGEIDCKICPDKIECSRCKRKLCHTHESTDPKPTDLIEGHYIMREGVVCVTCMNKAEVK